MTQELAHNVATVNSALRGGRHGLAGLVELPENHFLETDHHSNRINNPGELPPCGTETDANVFQEMREEFELSNVSHQTCNNTEEALNSQIEECIDPQCHGEIWQDVHCFGTRTIQNVLECLMSQCGNASPDEKMNILPNMIKPLPPHTPITSVLKQIEDGVKFSVRAGAPITASQQLMAAETPIMKMGVKCNHAHRK